LIVPRLSKRDCLGLVRPSVRQALASDALEGLFGAGLVASSRSRYRRHRVAPGDNGRVRGEAYAGAANAQNVIIARLSPVIAGSIFIQ
jgi:uncharacterized protein YfaT (DUF1175 family)